MLLVPASPAALIATPPSARKRRVPNVRAELPARRKLVQPIVLVVWFLLGSCILLCVPAARGDARWGASVPFWLVAAPLIDLAWVTRRALIRRLRAALQRRSLRQQARRCLNARRPEAARSILAKP